MLHIRIGYSRVHVVFVIVSNLEVHALLGRSSINKCIKDIFPNDQNIVAFNFLPVPNLLVLEATSLGTTEKLTEAVSSIC